MTSVFLLFMFLVPSPIFIRGPISSCVFRIVSCTGGCTLLSPRMYGELFMLFPRAVYGGRACLLVGMTFLALLLHPI